MPTQSEALIGAHALCPPSAHLLYAGDLAKRRSSSRRGRQMSATIWFSGSRPARRANGDVHRLPVHGRPSRAAREAAADEQDREFVPLIRAALGGVRQYIRILHREYLGSDLTEPVYGPVEFELQDRTYRWSAFC